MDWCIKIEICGSSQDLCMSSSRREDDSTVFNINCPAWRWRYVDLMLFYWIDLNPIELLWNELDRREKAKKPVLYGVGRTLWRISDFHCRKKASSLFNHLVSLLWFFFFFKSGLLYAFISEINETLNWVIFLKRRGLGVVKLSTSSTHPGITLSLTLFTVRYMFSLEVIPEI